MRMEMADIYCPPGPPTLGRSGGGESGSPLAQGWERGPEGEGLPASSDRRF
jgi:hypothetical protein